MDNIYVIADIHIAKIWDEINLKLPNYPMINPNKIMESFLKSLNQKDKLVINGDLIDYYFDNYYEDSFQDKSVNIFKELMKNFKGEYFINLGNHDYRQRPYNFKIYGLKHLNISRKIQNKYLKNTNNKFRFFSELKSIRSKENIKKDLNIFNTNKFYSRKIGSREIIFLDTGVDAFTSCKSFFNERFLKNISAKYIISKGLNNDQLRFLKKRIEKNKELFIFIHNPPFFSLDQVKRFEITNYYKQIISKKMSTGVFLNNNKEFMELIMNSETNITVISSHMHIPKNYIVYKKNKVLKQVNIRELNDKKNDPNAIKFITTYPLGAIENKNKKIGFLKITDKYEHVILDDFTNNYLVEDLLSPK